MYSTDDLWKMTNDIEQEITDIALRGADMVPDPLDMPRLRALADMLYDLSEGRNEVIFNKKGQPNIMVNFPCDMTARLDYLSGGGTYFDKDKTHHVAPAFIVKGKVIEGFRVGKYNDVIVRGTNKHLSLFGLAPAWGGGGDVQSYDGLAAASDRINAGACAYGEKVHQFTRAEYAYLGLLSVVEGFQVRGANSYGKDGTVSSEAGSPCGPKNDWGHYHVLTGSGPLTWRHDGTPFGVWGLNGPVYQILHGYITDAGEMLFLPDNDAADSTAAELAGSSVAYKGILEDGTFTTRGSADDLKLDFKAPATGDGQAYEIVKTITNQNGDHYGGIATSELTARPGVTIPAYLPMMLCSKLKANTPHGTSYMRNGVGQTRCVWAGANYGNGSSGGFGQLNGSLYYLSYTHSNGGGRVASIMQNQKY